MQEQHTPEKIRRVANLLGDLFQEYYVQPENRGVVAHRSKQELVNAVRERAPREGKDLEAVLREFKEKVMDVSVKTWHPLFFNQMSAGACLSAVVGDALSSMINATMATWEMSPAGTLIERTVAEWMARILGMPEGSGGIVLPGGSMANLLALTVARNRRLGMDVAKKGLACLDRDVAIMSSEASHYSIANAANLLGIGMDRVIKVGTNHRNEMLFEDFKHQFERAQREGIRVFAAVVTLGSTVTGGYDPLESIARFCRDRDIHVHVDAAFGGGLALSSQRDTYFAGVEYADTIIWDVHKWLYAPLTGTVLLAPNPGIFKQVFSTNANYIFHPQQEALDFADDLGQHTLLCGKRLDTLATWFLFKTLGENHLRDVVESRVQLGHDFYRLLERDADFEPSYEPISPLQCFRFRPKTLIDAEPAYSDGLHRWVREQVKIRNVAMFNITKFKGADHFRLVLINPLTSAQHLRDVLEKTRAICREYLHLHPMFAT